jgi:hypothetical protein
MSDTIKILTKEEKESSIRIGLGPCGGDLKCKISLINGILGGSFNWRKEGNTLHIEHNELDLIIEGNTLTFNWK